MKHLRLKSCGVLTVFLLVGSASVFANEPPEITYLRAQEYPVTEQVLVNYNVTDYDGDLLTISMVLLDSQGNIVSQCPTVWGQIGPNIHPGNGKHFFWDAKADFPGHEGDDFVLRLYADDGQIAPGFVLIPPESVSIPATFTMGSTVSSNETPHQVTLTHRFNMASTEVTNSQYVAALQWAYNQGLVTATTSGVRDDLDGSTAELVDLDGSFCKISFSSGVFTTSFPDRPVVGVSWYGSVAYCDWLSLQGGQSRAYNHSTWSCNSGDPYNATGYRLPTEAEWEFACRAGTTTHFNTGDCLNAGTEANYDGRYPYTGCPSGPYLGHMADVGNYPANQWGLFDIHGNDWEWCNDWYGAYSGDEIDPVGAGSGDDRVLRGGSWNYDANLCRSANRCHNYPSGASSNRGFRPVRSTP